MLTIPGYQINKKIYESDNTLVFRALRNQDNQPIIFKALKEDYPSTEDILRYKQEYEITRSLEPLPGVIGTYGLEKYRNTLVMILEDFGGESLNKLMGFTKFSLSEFFIIAMQLVDILREIHSVNVIHKDINPSNIVFNPANRQLKIIDFGLSTVLPRENPAMKNHEIIEGTPTYISPKQTGRMNRSMYYSTDFYSLGATFYELLVNRPPFNNKNLNEPAYCHMAKQPKPPSEMDNEIPEDVSEIVMKLLSKNKENRCSNAQGIMADLKKCLERFHNYGSISNLHLGRKNITDRFKTSQTIPDEIVPHKLLDKLVKIVIENTGAQKGFLILKSNGKLLIEAEGTAGRENVTVLNSVPVDKAENLSAAIINYVARTHKCVVLNDVVFDGLFTRDPYILAHLPKSILCGPLLHKSKLIGILYLENNFVTGAFTNRRLKSVKLLSSQIAVSLENARLYENMKNQTEEIKSAS